VLLAASVPDLSAGELALRLVAAAALGAAIGLERELREHEAGLRTHLLVSVGSALFTLASAYGFRSFLTSGDAVIRADPTRIAAQIVTGIGFIGAGAILRQGLTVRGLTTAATLWVVAAIGLACGAGYYYPAALTTAIVLFALWPLRYLARDVIDRMRPEENRLTIELTPGHSPVPIIALFEQAGAEVDLFELDEERDRRVLTIQLNRSPRPFVPALSELDYVIGVRWRR
jgi:putative Mg2+ transporter-C (MgtC) family protein